MAHLFTYLFGLVTGLYISAQTKVLSMPTFKLPKHITLDSEAIIVAGLVGGALLLIKIATRKTATRHRRLRR